MTRRHGILALAVLILFSVVPAHATFILQFNEAGNGQYSQNGGPWVNDPGFILAVDPTGSGLANVLVFNLPETVGTGDVKIADPTGGVSDILRFTSTQMFFYSADTGGGLAADTGLPESGGSVLATEDAFGYFDYKPVGNEYQGISGSPEPGSVTLLGLGLAGLGLAAQRLRKK